MTNSERSCTHIELIHEARRLLEKSNIIDPLRNVEWMLCELFQCSRAQLYAYPKNKVPDKVLLAFNHMLERRAKCEPLQYILGYTEFYGIRINVAPGVLIPRPETELLVEEALRCLKSIKSPSILDVGTGSGCIALALKHKRPDAEVSACDISEDALRIAQDNARNLDLQIGFFYCDIRSGIEKGVVPQYDLVISNPPYIPREEKPTIDPEVKDFEPDIALFVNDDPLEYYRSVAQTARKALKKNGFLCFETHMDYATDVKQFLENEGFGEIRVIKDLAHRPRIVIAHHP